MKKLLAALVAITGLLAISPGQAIAITDGAPTPATATRSSVCSRSATPTASTCTAARDTADADDRADGEPLHRRDLAGACVLLVPGA